MTIDFDRFLAQEPDVVRVRITRVQGSAPRDCDAVMYVSRDGVRGTIGGGQLEYLAIEKARALLDTDHGEMTLQIALGPDLGQCCGGRVALAFDVLDDAGRAQAVSARTAARAIQPVVHICGAGHVGRALADCFALLPVRTRLIDGRADELKLCTAKVEHCLTALPEAEIRNAPAGSAFVVLTHDHALDFLLATEALQRGDAAYVGMIGSATKRTRFERYHADHATAGEVQHLVCPIGATGSTDKRPEVIAAFVAAEVMTALTRQPVETGQEHQQT